jgi:iron transport multicopper oxidase
VTWVWANPDGLYYRPVVGINNQWPCPKMEANVNDTIEVVVHNQLGNETTGIHFHGIKQINTADMDGPSGVTQCPVPPGSNITYEFFVDIPGTFWYHSHNMGQYPDGLRGPFIVHDPNDPYKGQYDEEVVMSVSDWYHDSSIVLMQNMLQPSNTQFRPPLPDALIVNEGQNANINFVKGKTYRVRLINYAALGSALVHFDSHTMSLIMDDATYVQKTEAYQLHIAPAQRYDFLLTARDSDSGNYPFLVSLDINRDFKNVTADLSWPHNVTGYLVMDSNAPMTAVDVVYSWNAVFDDSHLLPLDNEPIWPAPTKTFTLDFNYCLDQNGYPRSCFNNKTYIAQKVPTMYSVATTGDSNEDPTTYGQVNPFIYSYDDIIEIVINNHDVANHPFHLHGHQFQVLDRPRSGAGVWQGDYDYPSTPARKDTVVVNANSYAVLRYRANNPGVYLFHCHIEWHVEMGLTATFIEAPEKMRGMTFPEDHIDNCKLQNIPYAGNAGGNTQDFNDESNYITVPPTYYTGATYVAV